MEKREEREEGDRKEKGESRKKIGSVLLVLAVF